MTYLEKIAHRIRENLPAEARPPAEADALFLIYAVLVRAKGVATTAEDVHDAWAAWMLTVDPGHRSVLPYDELKPAVQNDDLPYLAAIRRTSAEEGARRS
ncbi:DUF7701 domain-containing protein [Bailinhaonella thermotolerans]|uniref:DUF7701 domain-containing protein n=1 Tax=Bailinhaonella thermotolerans TaxID=1070861 RepID=A0A3A4B0Y9_9ACTN|nr:hypothetical protein [Bailinhaonella thermotolerans]RJL31753.1 hypothetical protein D5H75_18845 [Bailinhaonella thermotolerans]